MARIKNIGELLVGMSIDTRKMDAGAKRAEKHLKKVDRAADSLKGRLTDLAKGFVAAWGAQRIWQTIRDTATELDRMAKMASRLNVTVRELEKFGYIAQRTGVQVDTMHKALEKMAIRISEAQAGTGEAVNVLAELNMNVRELNQLNPAQQFSALMEAMAGETTQNKLRMAVKLFEEEGVAIKNIIDLGAGGWQELEDRFDQITNPIDPEAVAQVEAMNDALTDLGAAWKNMLQELVVAIGPDLAEFMNNAVEIVRWARAFTPKTGENTAGSMSEYERQMKTGEYRRFVVPGWDTAAELARRYLPAPTPEHLLPQPVESRTTTPRWGSTAGGGGWGGVGSGNLRRRLTPPGMLSRGLPQWGPGAAWGMARVPPAPHWNRIPQDFNQEIDRKALAKLIADGIEDTIPTIIRFGNTFTAGLGGLTNTVVDQQREYKKLKAQPGTGLYTAAGPSIRADTIEGYRQLRSSLADPKQEKTFELAKKRTENLEELKDAATDMWEWMQGNLGVATTEK